MLVGNILSICAALGEVAASLCSNIWLFHCGNLNSEEPGDQHPAFFPFWEDLKACGGCTNGSTPDISDNLQQSLRMLGLASHLM